MTFKVINVVNFKVKICWNIYYLFAVHWLTGVMCVAFYITVLIFVEDI